MPDELSDATPTPTTTEPGERRTESKRLLMDSKHLIALAALALAGCSATQDSVSLEHMHVSHPLLGPAVRPEQRGRHAGCSRPARAWHRDRYYMEIGLGQQMKDSGFQGDGIIFTSRIGVDLWRK